MLFIDSLTTKNKLILKEKILNNLQMLLMWLKRGHILVGATMIRVIQTLKIVNKLIKNST
jgi:hypothetical protein